MSKKSTLLFILLFALTYQTAFGQITGKLTDSKGNPIAYITASLLKAADSTLALSMVTAENGIYNFDNVMPAKYLLQLSGIGYQTLYTSIFELNTNQLSKDLGILVLFENSKQLSEIVISAKRPVFEKRADGIGINIENSVMSKGSSVLEVLERLPGVIIDHQNSDIMLNGKSGIMVMLNGKLVRMALAQALRMLSGMSANDIVKVELLSSPSAAYDAEGNGGLINIITKKSAGQGTNGSVSLTAGYGYGEKGTASLSISHNTRKVSLYGSYNFSHDKTYSSFHAVGSEQEPLLGGFASSDFLSVDKPILNNHQATIGIDSKLLKGLNIGGNLSYNNSNTTVRTINKGVYHIKNDNIYQLNASLSGINFWRNMTSNIYAEQQLAEGEKIALNIDHIEYKNDYPIDVQSSFIDQYGSQAGNNDTLFSPRLKSLSNTEIQIWVPKIDYTKAFTSKIILEAGLKGTQTRTNSSSAIQSLINSTYVSQLSAINQILMKEDIGAAYGSFKVKLNGQTELVTGLRYEYSVTRMDNLLANNNIANRRLGIWFPSILLSRKLNNDGEWLLAYSKRISRPSYSDLASYVTYNGPSSVNTGNPLLKPAITNNLKLGYNYHGYWFAALLSRDDNPIARYQIVYTVDKKQMAVSPQNMIYQNNLTFQTNIPLAVTDWWDMNYNLIGGWHRFKLDYTPQHAEKTYFSYNFNASQVFKLPAKYSIELSGYYNSAFYNGSKKVDGYGVLNAGIRKVLKNNGGSLQLSITDPLRINVTSSYFGALTAEAFDLRSHVDFYTEPSKYSIFKLSYSKSFGSEGNGGNGKRDSAISDESSRIKY